MVRPYKDLDMTREERKEKVAAMRRQGYNCAQSVAFGFTDITGLDEETTARAVAGFGGGMGAQGEVCGVVSAFAFIAGFMGDSSPRGKAAVYRDVRELTQPFREKYGRILCRELKSKENPVPCDELIMQGVDILCDRLENEWTQKL